jgi:hypothetical protein
MVVHENVHRRRSVAGRGPFSDRLNMNAHTVQRPILDYAWFSTQNDDQASSW